MSEKSFSELYKNCSQEDLNNHFLGACNYGEFDKVRYLLTSSDLTKHAEINYLDGVPLSYACMNGHLDIVKYLLSSPELTHHADIHITNDHPLYCAISSGNMDIVEYLISSPDLKEHADVHAKDDRIFADMCSDQEIEILEYLIFDYNIKKTQCIEIILNDNPNQFKQQVKNMFSKRELNITLEKDLSSDRLNKRKTKI